VPEPPEIVGVRLEPRRGIAGAAAASREPVVVSGCRADERFAAQIASGTGYMPHTMLVVPLERRGEVIGALSILDRRDGGRYRESDVPRAQLLGELQVTAVPASAPPSSAGRR
jgi:hypothetical protein